MNESVLSMKRVPDLNYIEEEPVKRRQATDNVAVPINPLSQTTSASSPLSDFNEDEKSVFVITNLSPDVTVEDIEYLCSPFTRDGPVRVVLQSASRSALVETHLPQQAATMVEYFNTHSPSLKGISIKAAFSDKAAKVSPNDLKVLLVSVNNVRFPVDIDILYRLFSVYGVVEKIVTFSKLLSRYQALIQFADARQAREATAALNNKCIFDKFNQLQIQTSKLTELVVRGNNLKSWDFTVAPYKSGLQLGSDKAVTDYTDPNQLNLRTASTTATPFGMAPTDYSSIINQANTTAMWNAQGLYSAAPAACSMNTLDYTTQLYPNNLSTMNMGLQSRLLTPAVLEKLPRELQSPATLHQINPSSSCVVICYNLPAEDITVEKLFNLLSLYGVVNRIKLLRDKPNTALAQYSDPLYATLACHFLANAPFFGSGGSFQIGISKKAEVKMPSRTSTDPGEAKRTLAFNARDQRCNASEVDKFIRGACKPTATLFIANIHESVAEEELRQILETVGSINKLELRPIKEESKKFTAMAEMGSEREALSAICHIHNARLRDSNLKLAFSKQILTSQGNV